MDESQKDWEQDWAKNQKEYDNRVVLPFTYEMVEAARNRGELFTRAQVHDVILLCWETLKNRPKDERGMVRVDITHSRPWQKVIAAASDKIRRGLVGPGIVSCHLEMDENRLNPHNSLPHPNFVLTHETGVEALYHPGKQKDSSLALVFRIDGEQRFVTVKLSKDDITQAFRLATKGKNIRAWKNDFASMIASFKAKFRKNGWKETSDFQIGADVWAWVLSEELKSALHDWLDQGCKGVKRKRDDVGPELTEPVSKIQLEVDDDVEDGVRISNAIFAQGDNLSVEAALERIREAQRGQRILNKVKVEPPEVVIVPCEQLRFTQQSCSGQFRGGPYKNKDLDYFIQDLISKDPKESCKVILEEEWLTLDIMKTNRGLRSIDNRRLHCLQEYQKYLQESGSSETVRVRGRIHQWTEEHDRYVAHNDTCNGGTDIKVRWRR